MSLVTRLAALVDAGQLTPEDVLHYANYPDRLLSAEERRDLGSLVADMTALVPRGRSDGAEFVSNDAGNAEHEARFAAGLVRKGTLGFASESDMNVDWEGAYFSMYHPAELNPRLRLFANQLNSKVSLVRPTTQRNQSVPMFLTPGIDRDPANTRLNGQLKQLSDRQAHYSQLIAQQRQEFSRLSGLGTGNPNALLALQSEIKYLETQIAALDIYRRQLYGTNNAYLDNTSTEAPLPAVADSQDLQPLPAGAVVDPAQVAPKPVADAAPHVPRKGISSRAEQFDDAFQGLLGDGASASAAGTSSRVGPTNVNNLLAGPDNGEGGSGGGRADGEGLRRFVDRPPTTMEGMMATIGGLLGNNEARDEFDDLNGWSEGRLLPPTSSTQPETIGMMYGNPSLAYYDSYLRNNTGRQGMLAEVKGAHELRIVQLEEARQQSNGFNQPQYTSLSAGSEHAPPGTTPAGSSSSGQAPLSMDWVAAQTSRMEALRGANHVPDAAGDNFDYSRLTDGVQQNPGVRVMNTKAPPSSRMLLFGPEVTRVPRKTVDLMNNNPQNVLLKLNKNAPREQEGLLKSIFRAWAHGQLMASAQEAFASDPVAAKFLADHGVHVQAVSSTSRGYSGRKRAAARVVNSRGRGRGFSKGIIGGRGPASKRVRRH